MHTNNHKQVLILDEPEQGLDPIIGVRVIQNIFNMFQHKTIIMISHICDCQLTKLNIKWKYKLNIVDGLIYNQS